MRDTLDNGTPIEIHRIDGATRGLVVAPDIFGLRPLFDDLVARFATEWGMTTIAVEPPPPPTTSPATSPPSSTAPPPSPPPTPPPLPPTGTHRRPPLTHQEPGQGEGQGRIPLGAIAQRYTQVTRRSTVIVGRRICACMTTDDHRRIPPLHATDPGVTTDESAARLATAVNE